VSEASASSIAHSRRRERIAYVSPALQGRAVGDGRQFFTAPSVGQFPIRVPFWPLFYLSLRLAASSAESSPIRRASKANFPERRDSDVDLLKVRRLHGLAGGQGLLESRSVAKARSRSRGLILPSVALLPNRAAGGEDGGA
jgi:hypothetical protein